MADGYGERTENAVPTVGQAWLRGTPPEAMRLGELPS
jgi:hypothetical protein